MGTQKGKLFELANMYRTYKHQDIRKKRLKDKKDDIKNTVSLKGEHYDEGKSITLSYDIDLYPETFFDARQRQEQAAQMSDFDGLRTSESFFVEPFSTEETVDIPYREARDDEDARLNRMVRGFASESEETFDDVADKMKGMEGKLDDMLKGDESSAMEATDLGGMSQKAREDIQALRQDSSTPQEKTDVNRYGVSDEEFAKDLTAILQGQKVYDAELRRSVSKSESSRPSLERQEKSNAPVTDTQNPSRDANRIFDQIAKSMSYANAYDLGAISLSEKFDMMDKEIEREEVNAVLKEKDRIPEAEVIQSEISRATSDAAESTTADASDESNSESSAESVSMDLLKFDPAGTLDNHNGGRLIKENQLQKCDLILASSSGAFDVIEGTLGSECIAGLFTGNNKVLTKDDGGALVEKDLLPFLGNKGVMVTLRHQAMSAEKASSIVDSLTKLRPAPGKDRGESWLKISCPSISLHPDVCNAEGVSDKKKCNAYAGKIYLGTMNNDSFSCAESIISAFEKSGLAFVPTLSKEHNGSLKYVGHLKNKA